MKLTRIMRAVYMEPWLIRPEMHQQISKIVQMHISGEAHAAGIMDMFQDEEKPMSHVTAEGCGVIQVCGVIGKGLGKLEKSSGMADTGDISKELETMMANDSVRAIVMAYNSPGGAVSGVPELAEEIFAASKTKTIFSYTDDMCCSAAYWLASQGNAMMASSSAVVGSIGVYMPFLDASRALEMQGLKQEVIKAGKFKGAGVPGTSLTEDQRMMLQERVDYIHNNFKQAVGRGRETILDDAVMQGQDFFAPIAQQVGLIDEVCSMQSCITQALSYRNTRGGKK